MGYWRYMILQGFYPYLNWQISFLPSPSLQDKLSKELSEMQQCDILKAKDTITLPKSVAETRSPLAEKDIAVVLGHMRSIIHDFECGSSMADLANQHGMKVEAIEEVIRFAMELK